MTWLRPIDQWFADRVFVHQDMHRAYARRLMRNPDDAEDLVQEAYARLFRLENWEQIANPHAFTMRILHNEAMERFRRADVVSIERGAMLSAMEPVDDDPGPYTITAARGELKRVAEAIETLPARCSEAIHLRRIDGLSPKEVAAKMEISVSTVEKHLTKGLRLLFDRLSRQDEASQAMIERTENEAEWMQRRQRERP